MRVLAVDPGLTVGYATFDSDADNYEAYQCHKWPFLNWADPDQHKAWFDIVVVERFTITPQTLKMSRQPHPIEVIGVLRWWCESTSTTLIEQTPSEAKSFMTNDRLKHLGLYEPGADHANDAVRHLALYLVKTGYIDPGSL